MTFSLNKFLFALLIIVIFLSTLVISLVSKTSFRNGAYEGFKSGCYRMRPSHFLPGSIEEKQYHQMCEGKALWHRDFIGCTLAQKPCYPKK